jgi:hypothetical protein
LEGKGQVSGRVGRKQFAIRLQQVNTVKTQKVTLKFPKKTTCGFRALPGSYRISWPDIQQIVSIQFANKLLPVWHKI